MARKKTVHTRKEIQAHRVARKDPTAKRGPIGNLTSANERAKAKKKK